MDPIRVLVTGAGSGVGQGIVKALRLSTLPLTVIGADIHPLNAALYRADEAVLLPKVESKRSLETIISKIREHRINVVMIGSEFDLLFFAQYKAEIEAGTGTLVVVSSVETVEIANDKYLTAEFLRKNSLPCAESFVPANSEEAIRKAANWGYPMLLKPRAGTSSRHVHIVRNDADLRYHVATVPTPLLQKLIDVPSAELKNEYTCSIFKCKDGTLLGPFTARRTLRSGHSWVVEVDEYAVMHSLMREIGSRLDMCGTLNVQLMIGPAGPVPFEFNARFSGTTAVRAHFGFNEPDMALRNFYLGETLLNPVVRKGLAFRYPEEVFVDNVRADELAPPFPKGYVRTWF